MRISLRQINTSTLACLVLLAFFSSKSFGANSISPEELKTGYIYNILKNITWPNEQQISVFSVVYYGDNKQYLNSLKLLQNQTIRKKPIRVTTHKKLGASVDNHVFIIDQEKNTEIKTIARKLLKSHTLIITDENTNKSSIMINFTKNNDTITFELNRSNIIYEGLTLSKQILLVGGTELDVATIYKETEHELNKTKKALQAQHDKLEEQKLNLENQRKKTQQQQNEIDIQKTAINQHKSKINDQKYIIKRQQTLVDKRESELKAQKETLKENLAALKIIQNELDISRLTFNKNTNANIDLNKQIEKNNSILMQQQKKLAKLEIKTSQQQVELTTKDSKIIQQRSVLYLTGGIIIFVMIAIIFIYFNYLQKRKAALILEEKNLQLKDTMKKLNNTQDQLIESEKMASLGTLVTGVAHEINTPLGVAYTVSSDTHDRTLKMIELFQQQKVTANDFSTYCETMKESTELLENNLGKVADLVKSFKEVSVDQSGHQKSQFDLSEYIHEVTDTYKPLIDKHKHTFVTHVPDTLVIDSYPGAFFQIFSTLIMNSITHAFYNLEGKTISIDLSVTDNTVELIYADNGPVVDQEIINNIFDPFYTTKRGAGYTGLGCHILYNLSTQLLKGEIICRQCPGGGLMFKINFPAITQVEERPL